MPPRRDPPDADGAERTARTDRTADAARTDGADGADTADRSTTETRPLPRDIDRRGLLALSGAAAAGALAGCGGGDGDGGGDTTTTAGSQPTSTSAAPTTAEPTSTAEQTTETATTSTTDQPTTVAELEDPSALVNSPSSHIQPTDGFASADWLVEADEVEIVTVTTLDSEGEGSLRWALEEKQGPRVVVFEVGGVIDLGSADLQTASNEGTLRDTEYGSVFVAGQTAPPPGITILRGELSPYAKNCIFQHIRVRVGDDVNDGFDAVSIGTDAGNCIVDHCSTTWSIDECLSSDSGKMEVAGKTISNNIIAEGLHDSIHRKGPHSKGTLIEENGDNYAVMGNVYAHNDERHPRLKGGVQCAIVNNVAYNYGVAIGMGLEGEVPARASCVGNHFIAGDHTDETTPVIFDMNGEHKPEAYVEDFRNDSEADLIGYYIESVDEKPLWPEGLEALPADEVLEHNLNTAGARPAERTHHDTRVLDTVRNRGGKIIDSQSEVGGYPDLEATERPLDPPEFGPEFAEWLTQHTRAVELGESPPE